MKTHRLVLLFEARVLGDIFRAEPGAYRRMSALASASDVTCAPRRPKKPKHPPYVYRLGDFAKFTT